VLAPHELGDQVQLAADANHAVGSLRTCTRPRWEHDLLECEGSPYSCRRAEYMEEEEEIKRRSSACSQCE